MALQSRYGFIRSENDQLVLVVVLDCVLNSVLFALMSYGAVSINEDEDEDEDDARSTSCPVRNTPVPSDFAVGESGGAHGRSAGMGSNFGFFLFPLERIVGEQ